METGCKRGEKKPQTWREKTKSVERKNHRRGEKKPREWREKAANVERIRQILGNNIINVERKNQLI